MKSFKDINGNTWEIKMTIGTCQNVKDSYGFDLLHPETAQGEDGKTFYELVNEDSLFEYKIILALCEESIKNNGYNTFSENEIGYLFDGKVLKEAREAFYEEYQNFFQLSGKTALATYLKKMLEVEQVRLDLLDAKTKSLDSKLVVADAMKEIETTTTFGE